MSPEALLAAYGDEFVIVLFERARRLGLLEPPHVEDERPLTAEEAADYLNRSVGTVYNEVSRWRTTGEGLVARYPLGHKAEFWKADLDAYRSEKAAAA